MATASRNLPVEANGIYLLLWNMGNAKQFHWGVFIALTTSSGILYHCTNTASTHGEWVFQERTDYNLGQSANILVALKISEVVDTEKNAIQRVRERLASVEFQKPKDNCQSWAMYAVALRAEEGYIGLPAAQHVVDGIESEADDEATRCRDEGKRVVKRSDYYRA